MVNIPITKNTEEDIADASGRPREGELELINGYTRKKMTGDDVYVFSVALCDNEIDRDYERFSDSALERLAVLFVGVTGIADHDAKSSNQCARIISCGVEEVEGKLCSDGRQYKRLLARAYAVRNGGGELIGRLESGIVKEVSVGCAVKKRVCSVCGKDIAECEHIQGREYGGRLCYAVLEEPADAYEWSFVAVPAQKMAGVVRKSKNGGAGVGGRSREEQSADKKKDLSKGVMITEIEKKLFSGEEQSFSREEMQELVKRFRSLERKAVDGDYYRDSLIREIKSLSALVLPMLGSDTLCHITEQLSVPQLNEVIKALEGRAVSDYPLKPQLMADGHERRQGANSASNKNYQKI